MIRFAAALALSLLLVASDAADLQTGTDAYKRGDYATARRELEPLAQAGDPLAQYVLGYMYALGRGVPRDDVQALKWFNLAERAGQQDAANAKRTVRERMSPAQVAEADRLAARFSPAPAAGASSWATPPTQGAELPSGRALIEAIQSGLAGLGYDPGPADGLMGSRTRDAIAEFQRSAGLPVDGEPSQPLLVEIRRARSGAAGAVPTGVPAASVGWFFTEPAKTSVEALVDALDVLLANRDDKALRAGVTRIVQQSSWPWTERVFGDDFSKPATQGGLDWRVVHGEFAIQDGLVSDARASAATRAEPAPAPTRAEPAPGGGERSTESQVIGIIGAILADRLGRERPARDERVAERAAVDAEPARIQLSKLFDSRFLMRTQIRVEDPGRGMDLALFRTQGGQDEELRLRFDPASGQIVMEHVVGGGARWLASAPAELADRELHALEWASGNNGAFRVALDGKLIIADAPGAPGGVFHGFTWRNHGGRYVMRRIEMHAARRR